MMILQALATTSSSKTEATLEVEISVEIAVAVSTILKLLVVLESPLVKLVATASPVEMIFKVAVL